MHEEQGFSHNAGVAGMIYAKKYFLRKFQKLNLNAKNFVTMIEVCSDEDHVNDCFLM